MDRSEEVKAILQKACDRDWSDETLYQTAVIAANAIYWRDREIERLKALRPEAGALKVVREMIRGNPIEHAIVNISEPEVGLGAWLDALFPWLDALLPQRERP